MKNNLLEIKNLSVEYEIYTKKPKSLFKQRTKLHAINNVNLDIKQGEILGVVGESGCGKSTFGKTLLKLLDSNASVTGEIKFNGVNINGLNEKDMKEFRKNAQIIFQDPLASLNPKMLIKDIIAEPLKVYYPDLTTTEVMDAVFEIMDKVGLAKASANKYPHEFSGGQCQRIGIARAMILKPKLLICDEAVSALDVSIKAQVINLLRDLQSEFNMAIIFISHDLSVVKYISDKIAVFYLGYLVEYNEADALYKSPKHPYTKALISSIPSTPKENRIILTGDIPSPLSLQNGCPFASRCSYVKEACKRDAINFTDTQDGGKVACINPLN
jgi:oligopeptide transport system ATP-binding protein